MTYQVVVSQFASCNLKEITQKYDYLIPIFRRTSAERYLMPQSWLVGASRPVSR